MLGNMMRSNRSLKILTIGLLVGLSESTLASRLEVLYKSPAGEVKHVPVLFGNKSNPDQREVEWAVPKDSADGSKGYIPLYFRYALKVNSIGNAFLLVDGKNPKEIDIENGKYFLRDASLKVSEVESLSLLDKYALQAQSEVRWALDDAIPPQKNYVGVWMEQSEPYCGKIKYVVRRDEVGEPAMSGVVFENHGEFFIPYEIQKITCTPKGRIVLQLAYYVATGGIRSTDDEWDYNQSIAIIDTGIAAVE